MKTKYILFSLVLLCSVAFSSVKAQTSTFYFMEEVPTRHGMNPAFIPNSSWYFDFIILPSFYTSGGNNAFTLKDGIFKHNNQIITAFHPSQNIDKLYKRVRNINTFGGEFGVTLFDFGFTVKEKNYFTVGLGMKSSVTTYLARDLFKLGMYGTPDEFGVNSFNLKKTGIEASVYSELSVGYMREINDEWTVGGKLKYLMGYSSIHTRNKNMTLNASQNAWQIDAQTDIYGSIPADYQKDNSGNILFDSPITALSSSEYLKSLYSPAGHGFALDLGATYEPIEYLVISAAITDLGFIRWNKNLVHGSMHGNYEYNGINYQPGDTIDWEVIGNEIKDAFQIKASNGSAYTQRLTANANVGIEYGILENQISFGALSRTRIHAAYLSQELTLAANFRPTDWFKAYLSYSFLNSRANNIGLGLNLRVGPVNMYIAADYIPLNWAKITSTDNNGVKESVSLPYNTSNVNLQAGMTFNFGRSSSDKDRDGVSNRLDKCPDTDISYLQSLCPEVKRKDFVDTEGCILDEDQDGVPDCYDRCPNTPKGVIVDANGCPIDSDGDGVPDYLDKCPNTPTGVTVDTNGCPVDSDGDGVPDYLDKCPNTPKEAIGYVDANGCPKDSDSDGVPDYLDKCPDTPTGVKVDTNGCPIDSDGDGVPDYLDKCPNTPKEAIGYVDANGCPKDSDGDGVPDYLDKCPKVAGTAANKGCPELKPEVKRLFKQALQGIQFETGKDVIKKSSYAILNQVAQVMKDNPDFKLNIAGHTDNTGNEALNQELSERRAAAVKKYLVEKGVDESRMTSEGFGQSQPIDTNKTAAGRKNNRRVEFTVTFER